MVIPSSHILPKTKRTLTDENEIDRINDWLEGMDRFGYTEILEKVAMEEDEMEGIHSFQQWIDSKYPELSGVVGGAGAYDFEMRVFIRRVLETNVGLLSPQARAGVRPGAYIEGVAETVREEIPALVPAKKGTPGYVFRYWEDEEISIMNELIAEGRVWQDAYVLYLAKRIGKIGRTREAFRKKWGRFVRRIRD